LNTKPTSNTDQVRYPRRLLVRWLLRTGIYAGLSALADIQVNGRENFPEAGPLLIVGNHFSFLDPVAMIHITRYPLEFIGGTRTPNAPGWTEFFRQGWGILPIIRGGSSRDGLLRAQRILEQKGVLGIFPEGGSWATVLRPPRPGAVLLAARTNARILPIGFDGLTDVFPIAKKRKRAKVTINVGKPFGPYQLDMRDRTARQAMDNLGHEVMRHIAELIPPEKRGFYSDDPAIREAAKGTEIYPWDGLVET
jgi:1-acyl-sn-glycerol-3-phosphate acyltransferase